MRASRLRRACCTLAIAGTSLTAATSAGAQLWRETLTATRPTISVVSGIADHRVDAGFGFERSSGPVFGAQLDIEIPGGAAVSLRGLGGTLDAKTTPAETRDIGELNATVRMRILSWLDASASATARSYRSSLARQRWTMLSLGGEGRVPLIGGFEGTIGGALIPWARVSGHASPDLALSGTAAIRWSGQRLDLALAYTLERYDFPQQERTTREEEQSGLVLRAGYKLF